MNFNNIIKVISLKTTKDDQMLMILAVRYYIPYSEVCFINLWIEDLNVLYENNQGLYMIHCSE
jgi:hypothetical protein